ncbi:MAG: hypothetical protein NPIRA03_35540 [Nitrospirales bacterium]|nr:MAG: hypothetical protein NPIRA03_35540 [Nitrospirales bacterium]
MDDLTTFPTDKIPCFLALMIDMFVHQTLMGTDFFPPVYKSLLNINGLFSIHAYPLSENAQYLIGKPISTNRHSVFNQATGKREEASTLTSSF